MDFFARQEGARAQTRKLVALFVLAVIVVDLAVTAVLAVLFGLAASTSPDAMRAMDASRRLSETAPILIAICALGVLATILVGASMKSLQLQSGGAAVAGLMGADLVDPATRDPLKKRLLNVVEEMALASGVPVPAVYVMERESGVNAFAAGHTPADSVVAVTRGALERFDRDELQGVIGHEFSHILNGDMRLNMRLVAMVAGLWAIATVGRILMRGGARSRRGAWFMIAGLAMMALGGIGLLLGRMIQAAISRQREFLADASAVQFTRDPSGLRDALVKVGASAAGSRVHADRTDEVAHMLFASGTSDFFATHPPLVDRIRALDPSFQPEEFERVRQQLRPLAPASIESDAAATLAGAQARVAIDPGRIAGSVANPRPPHVRYAERLRAALPHDLAAGVGDPSAARALLGALLWTQPGADRPQAAAALASALGTEVAAEAAARRPMLNTLPTSQRLPLLLELVPALGRLPLPDRRALLQGIEAMVRSDGALTLSDYALARLAFVHLGDQIEPPPSAARATLLQLEPDLQVVLSTLARHGHSSEGAAREAYERGLMLTLPGRRLPYRPLEDWVPAMDAALDRLDHLRPADKQRLIHALGMVVAHDGTLSLAEAELLRAVCGSLHCPLPPIVEETAASAG